MPSPSCAVIHAVWELFLLVLLRWCSLDPNNPSINRTLHSSLLQMLRTSFSADKCDLMLSLAFAVHPTFPGSCHKHQGRGSLLSNASLPPCSIFCLFSDQVTTDGCTTHLQIQSSGLSFTL